MALNLLTYNYFLILQLNILFLWKRQGNQKIYLINLKQKKNFSEYWSNFVFFSFPDDAPSLMNLKDVRPRARELVALSEIKEGDTVLVNYNIEEPSERGYW